ncbi:sugar phosphate isomerase/epimerase [Cellulomonas cellasea]|uniref:Sugar phosphate isomerase/epimerase n=1 Tax=Cellulomonas cellasea TaxID=43670 RepID=A0A7W4YCI8_9CELL|nr:sugar phosphate isomerase/epimerase [Cellulomonas cellasea]MBB2924803.1 sugar phosphate isomerase/epimerase [Cellulomonas cellasea]
MATIGVQASTIKNAFTELGTFATLRRVADLGYRAVEISQVAMTPENVAQMGRAQDELGVRVAALSASLTPQTPGAESLTTTFDKIVDDCRTLGTTMVRIGMLPLDAAGSLGQVTDFARRANEAAARLAAEGVDLYYHNHHIEFARLDGRLMLDVIADTAPDLGMEIDVHWVHRGGHDPVATLAQHAGRVRLVHLKDYRIGLLPPVAAELLSAGDVGGFMREFRDVVQFAEVGQGTLQWTPIVEQALASGAEYLFVEQDDTYGRDPFESLAMSRDHLVSLGYGDLF